MIQTGSVSYEELLAIFTEALNDALSGISPSSARATLSPTLALGLSDIASAVRDKRPTENLVTLACAAFTLYAADRGSGRHCSTTSAAAPRRTVSRHALRPGLTLPA